MSDIGMVSYKKAKKYRTTSKILNVASFLAGLSAVSIFSSGKDNDFGFALLASQVGFTIGSFKFNTLSNQSIDRAIWQRNKDLLFPSSK
jgi:hypothetical protein